MASGTRSQRHLLELGRPTSGGVRPGGGGPVADTRPPVITSISAINLPENTKLFHILAADEIVTWSIVGGADASKFEIILGSVLRFAGDVTRDYESPDDANLDRIYVVQLRAVDFAGNPATQIFTVTITDVDDV